jgi:guanosine-3',5'-bis(diphosphate) 3'-pyrophosphohydrolase
MLNSRSEAARKASTTRKRRRAARKAAKTRRRNSAAIKAWATRRKRSAVAREASATRRRRRRLVSAANQNDLAFILHVADFAARKHRKQRRKDAEQSAYVNHPIALAHLLAKEAGVTDLDVLAAAFLHDTIEDTENNRAELESAFGPRIAAIVSELTDDKSRDKVERKRLQIAHAASASHEAKLVKLADKICNLRDINATPPVDWSQERKRQCFDWAKQVVNRMRGTHAVLEALFDEEYARRT